MGYLKRETSSLVIAVQSNTIGINCYIENRYNRIAHVRYTEKEMKKLIT